MTNFFRCDFDFVKFSEERNESYGQVQLLLNDKEIFVFGRYVLVQMLVKWWDIERFSKDLRICLPDLHLNEFLY